MCQRLLWSSPSCHWGQLCYGRDVVFPAWSFSSEYCSSSKSLKTNAAVFGRPRLYLFKSLRFSLTASLTTVFYHSTGVLGERPPVHGIWYGAAEVIAAVRLCISSFTFPLTSIGVQATYRCWTLSNSTVHEPCCEHWEVVAPVRVWEHSPRQT